MLKNKLHIKYIKGSKWTTMIIWKVENRFWCHYSPAFSKCGALGAEGTHFLRVYTKEKWIHKIKYLNWENQIQMEIQGHAKSAIGKTVVGKRLWYMSIICSDWSVFSHVPRDIKIILLIAYFWSDIRNSDWHSQGVRTQSGSHSDFTYPVAMKILENPAFPLPS
jgi:hypothetical protein